VYDYYIVDQLDADSYNHLQHNQMCLYDQQQPTIRASQIGDLRGLN